MATIKSYTDINQSKKLAEFLSPESADLSYMSFDNHITLCPYIKMINDGFNKDEVIPCWSLASLLDVLPNDCCGIDKEDGKYAASYVVSNEGGTYISDNPVDACVAMIEKLHKLKML